MHVAENTLSCRSKICINMCITTTNFVKIGGKLSIFHNVVT